ncbi:MAG TPA: hypothetical protein VFE62_26960 [Gemmataceae bacterium]|nr:hypothetical protein [Gemmataceae bacterium]
MQLDYCDFVDQLASCLATINERIEAHVLSQMIAGGDVYYSPYFEFDLVTVMDLCKVLSADPALWADFRRAVEAHRPSTHWTILLEHVHGVGQVTGKLKLLEQGLSCPAADDRRRLAEHLNCLDGEIGLCRLLADRRDLAMRINANAGFPLTDGLSVRGLTYVLGEHPCLLDALQVLVEQNRGTESSVSFSRKDVRR